MEYYKGDTKHPVLQHYDDVRQEQCLNREYLLRQPKILLPSSLHARVNYQGWVVEQTLNRKYGPRRPELEIPGISALVPWLSSFIIEDEFLCSKCRKIDFDAVFRGASELVPCTIS